MAADSQIAFIFPTITLILYIRRNGQDGRVCDERPPYLRVSEISLGISVTKGYLSFVFVCASAPPLFFIKKNWYAGTTPTRSRVVGTPRAMNQQVIMPGFLRRTANRSTLAP